MYTPWCMRRWASLLILLAACGKGGGTQSLPAYLAGDSCHEHTDSVGCAADSACQWFAVGLCQAKDPCAAHGDPTSCGGDASCMWVGEIAGLCPPGATCPEGGGFCTHKTGDGCVC